MGYLDPYPGQRVLDIVEGPRLPPVRPGDEKGPARKENILDILAGAFNRRSIPDPATKKGQDVVDRIAKAGLPPQQPAGAQADCLLPSPWGCLLSRDTGTFFGVNAVLFLVLVIGALMLLVPVAAKGVTIVTGSSPSGLARRVYKGRGAKKGEGDSGEG